MYNIYVIIIMIKSFHDTFGDDVTIIMAECVMYIVQHFNRERERGREGGGEGGDHLLTSECLLHRNRDFSIVGEILIQCSAHISHR